MAGQAPPVVAETLAWRLAGAGTWHIAFFVVLSAAWAAVPAGGAWLSVTSVSAYLLLSALQLGVLLTHHMVLSASEAAPLYLPKLGLTGRSWLSAFISRVFLRGRRAQDLIAVAAFVGSTTFSAATFILAHAQLRYRGTAAQPSIIFSTAYGTVLGIVYSVQHLVRCRDVLTFQPVHRHRYFRIRQQLPSVVLSAWQIAGAALVVCVAAGYRPTSIQSALAALHSASLCAAGWLLAHTALQAVFSEQLRLGAEGAGSPVLGSMQPVMEALGSSSPLVQDLALQRLASIAEGRTAADQAQRADVFADGTGRLVWTPLVGYLLGELRDTVAALAAALPAIAGDAKKAAAAEADGRGKGMQWNVVKLAASAAQRAGSREQDMAAWTVRAKFYRLAFVMRALASLTAAARTEDRYGIVLLCDPGLADLLTGLLSAVMALQQYTKLASSLSAREKSALVKSVQQVVDRLGPPAHITLQSPEFCSHTLEDQARRCAYQVVLAFGPSLKSALKEAKLKPAYGLPADIAGLLNSMLGFQE